MKEKGLRVCDAVDLPIMVALELQALVPIFNQLMDGLFHLVEFKIEKENMRAGS